MAQHLGPQGRFRDRSGDAKASVLLVDDSPANLLALRALLEDLDTRLVESLSGEEALGHVHAEEFAVILLDVLMPGLSGFETARRIRESERSRHTPIIFLTASDIDAAQLEEGYALGAVDFLVKPLVPIVLRAKIRGFIDLFEQKQRARRESEQFRLLVQGTKDYAIFMLDPGGHIISWNPGAERLKGYRAEDIIGQHFSRFYPQEAIDRGWPDYELKVARAEGRFEDEGWRVRKDGSQFWANVVITALFDETGRCLGFSKITRDLTERKRAEENARRLVEEAAARRVAEANARLIQEQRERLQVTLESIGDAVISTDAEARVTFLNPVAERLVGWQADLAVGGALEDVFHIVNEETRQPVENPALRALRDGQIIGLANHTLLIAKDGSERPIDDCAAPIRDPDGKVLGSVLVFRDVTGQRRTEQYRNARLEVTQVLSLATTVLDGAQGVLQAVCENLGWDVGFFWVVDAGGQVLRCRQSWSRAHSGVHEFEVAAREYAFASRQGLPGRVWQSRESAWILDLDGDDNFPRLAIAQRSGLRSAFACPIVVGEQFLGVIEFFTKRRRETDADLLELMATVAGNVGQFLERKVAEAELLRSEVQFRQLADAMPQIVWTARPDGTIDYLNRRWTEFTGLPQTIDNRGWGQILHPDDAPAARARWAQSLEQGTPFEMEIRLLDSREQSYRWHLIRTVAVKHASGKLEHWFGTSTDIHEQKRAAESARYLAEASAALAVVVDYQSTLQKVANLAVPYFADWSAVDLANEDGTLRRLAVAHENPEKVALVQQLMEEYPPDPQSAVGTYAVLRSGQPEFLSEIPDELLLRGAKDERHLELIRSLGLKSYLSVPLIVAGKVIGVLTFATAESRRRYTQADLSLALDLAHRAAVAIENTQLYQALRESDRRKDEFLAMLAHELRNPLAPIRNSLQILKMPNLDPETVERSREMMERQVQHLVRLVDDLLDVSRVMRGKIELRKERVELATIVARAVETAQPLVDAQQHELMVQVPPESILIEVDPVRLTQVVGNLLTNAAKYTEPGGRIELTARREGSSGVLRVRDNGIGIAPEMLPRIFDLFVQVDHAATRAHGGLGIGLTLVKNLVEAHNGTVEAHSAGLGRGSEFIVRLPLASPLGEAGNPTGGEFRSVELPARSGHRLLVVDDNQDAANSLGTLLQLQGHEVRVAYSGMAALEITKTYRPDVIFLDIGMPGMDGYELARRLRQQPGLEAATLAALTGWGQLEDRRRTLEAGFHHHLVKPPDPQAIQELLESIQRRGSSESS